MSREIKVVKVLLIDFKNKISIKEYPNKNGQYAYSNQGNKKGYHFKCNIQEEIKYGDIVLIENGIGIAYGLVINVHNSIKEFLEDKNGRKIPTKNVLGIVSLASMVANRVVNIENYAKDNNVAIDMPNKDLGEKIDLIQNRYTGYANLTKFRETMDILNEIENRLYIAVNTISTDLNKFIKEKIENL